MKFLTQQNVKQRGNWWKEEVPFGNPAGVYSQPDPFYYQEGECGQGKRISQI
jgi:hypothetical protein